MKTILIFIFFLSSFVTRTYSQTYSNRELVGEFIEAYNDKDSVKVMHLLHQDFVELFESDTTIPSKTSYAHNYAWGKQMNDKIAFEIIHSDSNTVKIKSSYYCFRDKVLNLGPFVSQRCYIIKSNQIFMVIETYEEQNYVNRRTEYQAFFDWLKHNKNLSANDFPFNNQGAVSLKIALKEYASQMK